MQIICQCLSSCSIFASILEELKKRVFLSKVVAIIEMVRQFFIKFLCFKFN